MKNNKVTSVIKNGLFNENPVFRLFLGMCPTLAITTTAENGLGMGLATTFVLIFSNMVISMLRKIIPDKVRIPSYIVVIATFVSITDLLIKAYFPALSKSLGIFIPLIVVNCVIFARAESFASKNGVFLSIVDGFSMGIGFTLALTLLASIREIIGKGEIFGIAIMPEAYQPMSIVVSPAGGFIMLGLLLLIINSIQRYFENRNKKNNKEVKA